MFDEIKITDWIMAGSSVASVIVIIILAYRDKDMKEIIKHLSRFANAADKQAELKEREVLLDKERVWFEEQKHKNSIKPNFISGGCSKTDSGRQLELVNIGKKACKIYIQNTINENLVVRPANFTVIEEGKKLYFSLVVLKKSDDYQLLSHMSIDFKVFYEDFEGNKYYQSVNVSGIGKVKLQDPEIA